MNKFVYLALVGAVSYKNVEAMQFNLGTMFEDAEQSLLQTFEDKNNSTTLAMTNSTANVTANRTSNATLAKNISSNSTSNSTSNSSKSAALV